MPRRHRNARPIHRGEQKKGRHRLDRHTFDPFSYLGLFNEGDEEEGASGGRRGPRERGAPAPTAMPPTPPDSTRGTP